MALEIAALDVRCRVAPREAPLAGAAGDWLRDRFAARLAGHLGPSLDRLDGLTVVRELHVRVRLRAGDATESGLLDACSRAFGEALFRALATTGGDDTSRHFDGLLEYRAALIEWLLSGDSAGRWMFVDDPDAAVTSPAGSTAAEATLDAVLRAGPEMLPLLRHLRSTDRLGRLLKLWDEYAVERIIVESSRAWLGGDAADADLLLRVANAASESAPPAGRRFGSRHHALLIACTPAAPAGSIRAVHTALTAIRLVLERPAAIVDPRRALAGLDVSPPVLAILEAEAQRHTARAAVIAAVERLRPHVDVVRAPGTPRAARVDTSYAGAVLLLPMMRYAGWLDILGARAARWRSALVAGVLHASVARFRPDDPPLDRGLCLLAGVGADPSAGGVRELYTAQSDDERIELARALGLAALDSWEELLAAAAARLTGELAKRIRGFRRAGAATIADRFLRRPGIVTATADALRVEIAPSPWNIALDVSGFTGQVAAPIWLEHRPVILILEGL